MCSIEIKCSANQNVKHEINYIDLSRDIGLRPDFRPNLGLTFPKEIWGMEGEVKHTIIIGPIYMYKDLF